MAIAWLLVQGAALSGCVFLAGVNSTRESHIVDDRGVGFNVTMDADGKTIHVALDTQQSVERRMLWAVTFGSNEGPSASQFDAVASKWLNFEHPKCKVGDGRRIAMDSYEYGLTCPPAAAPKPAVSEPTH